MSSENEKFVIVNSRELLEILQQTKKDVSKLKTEITKVKKEQEIADFFDR